MNFSRYVRFKYLNTPHKLSLINHHMEKYTVTSTKKSFDKIQYPVMIKNHPENKDGGELPQH